MRAAAGRTVPVAVISYAMWQRRYGGAPDAIGKTISIERVPFTIIGVTPKGFFGPDVGRSFDVAVPLGTEPLVRPEDSALDERLHWWMNIMVRLKPGQTAEQATALAPRDPAADPAGHPAAGPRRGHARRLPDRSVHARSRRPAAGRRGARATNSRSPPSSSSSGSCC